jgi:hypothetical protein
MAKLKSKVADEAIYSCLQMLEVMDIWKNILSSFVERQSFGAIGGGTSEILKEILSKMIIDNTNYKPAVK